MTLPARRYPGGVTSDATRLDPAARELLDNALASAALEGAAISSEAQDLAVAYLAGDIDVDTYERLAQNLALPGVRRAPRSA